MPPTDDRPGNSRFDPAWLLLIAAFLLLARIGFGVWQSTHGAGSEDTVSWVELAKAPGQAGTSGRPILYDFNADWCPPCQAMKRLVFSVPEHARAIDAAVVPVNVIDRSREDGHNPAAVDSLQRAFGIEAFPTLVVYSPATGRSEKREGYDSPAGTVEWISRAAQSVKSGGPQ